MAKGTCKILLAIIVFAICLPEAYPCCLKSTHQLVAHQSSLESKTTADHVTIDEHYILDQWSAQDGLPVNSTTEIIKGEKGYLWFGTTDGLVRFDAVKFSIYKTTDYPQLHSNRIKTIRKGEDGIIWIGTDQGHLVQYHNGKFNHISAEDGLLGERFYFLYTDNQHRFWIGTDQGITLYQNGEFSAFHPDKIQGPVSRIHVKENIVWYKKRQTAYIYRFDGIKSTPILKEKNADEINPFLTRADGSILFGANRGIYKFSDGELKRLDAPSFQVVDLYQSRGGTIWVATRDDGTYQLKEDTWVKKHSGDDWILGGDMLVYHQNHQWFIGPDGVFKDARMILNIDSQISDYLFDHEGNLWLTTNRSGLMRIKPSLFTIYGLPEGAPHANVYAVAETDDGSIWFGTHGGGPVRLKNGQLYSNFDYNSVDDNNLTGDIYVQSMVERRNGDFLIALLGAGIYRFDKGKQLFNHIQTPFLAGGKDDGLDIFTLFEDSQERLWVGTDQGLYWLGNGVWSQAEGYENEFTHPVRYIAEAPDKSLWMATNGGGILHYRNKHFTAYDSTDGLSSNLIRSIFVEKRSQSAGYVLYIGSEDRGLNRIKVKEGKPDWDNVIVFNKKNGLYSNGIHQILEDNQNRLWMSTNQGLFYVQKSAFKRYSSGRINQITSTAYNKKNGLRTKEFNGGLQHAGVRADDGTLWFPTQRGLVKVNPAAFPHNTIPPPVVIEGLTSANQSVSVTDDSLQMLANQRNFEIKFTGLSFLEPEAVHFKYRLKGFDGKWIQAGPRRTAFYTNIPAGSYIFEVTAANGENVWNPNPARLAITVQPYFYETTTFYVLSAILAVALVIGVFQLRTVRHNRREEELEKSVQKRSQQLIQEKIKTEEQAQELRKLNEKKNQFFTNIAHELRTPLTMLVGPIKILHENEDISMQAVRNQLEPMLRNGRRLQRLINQLLELSRVEAGMVSLKAAKQPLSPFINKITLEFAPLADVKDITLKVDNPNEACEVYFDAQKLQKVLSNLLSNAMKFTPNNGEVRLQLTQTNTHAIIAVRDNGIGIDEKALENIFDRFYQVDSTPTRKKEGTGVGLAFAKELVELHEASLSVESSVGQGSVFTLSLQKGRKHLQDEQITETAESDIECSVSDDLMLVSPDGREYGPKAETFMQNTGQKDYPNLLVIDDNADIRNYVRTILGAEYTVLEAADGSEGLTTVRSQLPDLIICDVMMPELDGFALSKALRDDPMTEGIPLIFVTAMTDKRGELQGLDAGADAYITKPFDADILQARVKNLLAQRKRLHKLFADDTISYEIQNGPSNFEQQITEMVRSHLSDSNFTVAQLAEEAAMNRSHLSRKLKKLAGVTPGELIRNIRLERAACLLREGDGNISEIAYSVGFSSLAYFSRRFKEKYEVAPSGFLDEVMS